MGVNIFVTGATGFIGAHFVSNMARHNPEARIYCLVRSTRRQTSLERLDAILGRTGIENYQKRIIAVEGDLKSIGSAGTRADLDSLAPVISAVFHFAADVNFAAPIERSRRTNVEGLGHVLNFAQRCKAANPNFSHYAHISTAYVAGMRKDVVRESELVHKRGFKNNYEQSKYEGELLVREVADRLPLIVYRPSIVIGNSVTGQIDDGNTLYPVLTQIQKRRPRIILANAHARLDLIDVQHVASSIAVISSNPGNIGGVFHLAAGKGNEVRVKQIIEIFEARIGRKIWLLPYRIYPALVRPLLKLRNDGRFNSVLRFADAFGSYLNVNPQFDVTQARNAVTDAGLSPADPLSILAASLQATTNDAGVGMAVYQGNIQ